MSEVEQQTATESDDPTTAAAIADVLAALDSADAAAAEGDDDRLAPHLPTEPAVAADATIGHGPIVLRDPQAPDEAIVVGEEQVAALETELAAAEARVVAGDEPVPAPPEPVDERARELTLSEQATQIARAELREALAQSA